MLTDEQIRAAHRTVAWLFFVCGFAGANLAARLPSLAHVLKLNEQSLGLVLLCGALGALMAFRGAHFLIDRYDSRTVAATAGSILALTLVLPALAHHATQAAGALGLMGAASGLLNVSMNLQAAAVEKTAKRPLMSALHGICSLGSLVGAGLGAWMAHLGLGLTEHLASVGAVLFVPTLISGHFLPPDRQQQKAMPEQHATMPTRPLWVMGMIALFSSIGEGAMADWIGLYLFRDLGCDLGVAGLGYVVFSTAMVVGRLQGDRLWGHHPAPVVLGCASLLSAFGLAAGLCINRPWSISLGAAAVGFGLGPTIPCILRATDILSPSGASKAFAQVASIAYIGFLLGPPLIGFVGHHFGLRLGLGVVVLASGLLAALTRDSSLHVLKRSV